MDRVIIALSIIAFTLTLGLCNLCNADQPSAYGVDMMTHTIEVSANNG